MNELVWNGVPLVVTVVVAWFVVTPLALIAWLSAIRWLMFLNDRLRIFRSPWD